MLDTSFSQLVVGIPIERPNRYNLLQMFIGLFAAVMFAFVSFILKLSNDKRFDLCIGSFFGTVASAYIVNSNIPDMNVIKEYAPESTPLGQPNSRISGLKKTPKQ